ncbi:MAG: prolyl-tRNA synthetase associated domain-containing protein [Lachnospiraceae bacterium]|nr:prolyl-tRNA synthetase associated domain-containing protein [Lachnospiraceae bacterium]
MTLHTTTPTDLSSRTEMEQRSFALLEELQIPYSYVDHAPALTMEDCAEIDEVLGVKMCKNLVLCNRQKTDYYLLLMPGDKVFKTKELSSQINSARLSFASGEAMEELLGVLPGSASVLGLLKDTEGKVQLLIDKDLLCEEFFGCHPCKNTSSIRFSTEDLLNRVLPKLGHAYIAVELRGE